MREVCGNQSPYGRRNGSKDRPNGRDSIRRMRLTRYLQGFGKRSATTTGCGGNTPKGKNMQTETNTPSGAANRCAEPASRIHSDNTNYRSSDRDDCAEPNALPLRNAVLVPGECYVFTSSGGGPELQALFNRWERDGVRLEAATHDLMRFSKYTLLPASYDLVRVATRWELRDFFYNLGFSEA